MSVKNREIASLQISAEQILLEALDSKEKVLQLKQEEIKDSEELAEFRRRKRTEYEEALRRNRLDLPQWMRYAQWELSQKEFERARSIFERAIVVDYKYVPLWVRYAQSEIKERHMNHARNVLERATSVLPRIDKLWFTYVGLEEMLGNFDDVRRVFESWLKWNPDQSAWKAFIGFEKRHNNPRETSLLYSRMTTLFPDAENWVEWAEYEDSQGDVSSARDVFSKAVDTILSLRGPEALPVDLIIGWSRWEAKNKELERSRAIFDFAIARLPEASHVQLYDAKSALEKQFGDQAGLDHAVLNKRKYKLEEEVAENPQNYDSWWSLVSLVESMNDTALTELTYERAIKQIPQTTTKEAWRRFIYLWLRYVIYTEMVLKDQAKTREIYDRAIKVVPNRQFTFAKLWVQYAKFEIRSGDLTRARQLLGQSLGLSGKPKLFKEYIAIEKKLQEIDRCRKLYEKYLEKYSSKSSSWIEYASLEEQVDEIERARAIYELALNEEVLDDSVAIWLAYSELEANQGEFDRARDVFRRLIKASGTPREWIAFAMFEASTGFDENDVLDEAGLAAARDIFDRADSHFKSEPNLRYEIYEARKEFEETYGDDSSAEKVRQNAPKLVTKRRQLSDDTYEEVQVYTFPDESAKVNKLLENAKKWAGSK